MIHLFSSMGSGNSVEAHERRLVYREVPQSVEQPEQNSVPELDAARDLPSALVIQQKMVEGFLGKTIPVAMRIKECKAATTKTGQRMCNEYEQKHRDGYPLPPTVVQTMKNCPEPPPCGMQKILQEFSDPNIKPGEARYEALVATLNNDVRTHIDSSTHALAVTPRNSGGYNVYAWKRPVEKGMMTNENAVAIAIFDAGGRFVKEWKPPQKTPQPTRQTAPAQQNSPPMKQPQTSKSTPQKEEKKPDPKNPVVPLDTAASKTNEPTLHQSEKKPPTSAPVERPWLKRDRSLERIQANELTLEQAQKLLASTDFRRIHSTPDEKPLLLELDKKYNMQSIGEEKMQEFQRRTYELTRGFIALVDLKDILTFLDDMRLKNNEIHTYEYDQLVVKMKQRLEEKYREYAKKAVDKPSYYGSPRLYFKSAYLKNRGEELVVAFPIHMRNTRPDDPIGRVTHVVSSDTYEVSTKEKIGMAGPNGQKPSDGKFTVNNPNHIFHIIHLNTQPHPSKFTSATEAKVKEFDYMKSLFAAETIGDLQKILQSEERKAVDVNGPTWRTEFLTYLDTVHSGKTE